MLGFDWGKWTWGRGKVPSNVPQKYRDLYKSLDAKLTEFDTTVRGSWNGSNSTCVFAAEVLKANCNRGHDLLPVAAMSGINRELDALQSVGVTGVSLSVNFPILNSEFYEWTGVPTDYQRFLNFYIGLVANIRARGLKLYIESAVVFTGTFSAGSDLDVEGYYATLTTPTQLATGRARCAAIIATYLKPDTLNLGSEPDTEIAMTGQSVLLAAPAAYGAYIGGIASGIRTAIGAANTPPLGAGVGTWLSNGNTYIDAYVAQGIDFIDIHTYPVNFAFLLPNLITLTDRAISHGKPVAIGECWLLKQRDLEYSSLNAASNAEIFARDPLSFWAPLDSKLLESLVAFCHWKNITYLSPFWHDYFWAYVEYADTIGLTDGEIRALATLAASAALQAHTVTSTGTAYQAAIT